MSKPASAQAFRKPFSLLIKPTSHGCNLRCEYCFYLVKEKLYPGRRSMDAATLEKMVSSFMAVPMGNYSFGWQGGEPTLMGLDFFKRAVELQKLHGRNGAVVGNGLQTNGTLIDDEWGAFLAQYNFLIGISIDGPAELHDRFRRDALGVGSHARVMAGLEALRRNKVEHNGMVLVSAANVEHPVTVYNYLKELGIFHHQYIECVEFNETGALAPFAVQPEKWGEFLCAIFDEWKKRDVREVSVRLFDSIIHTLVLGEANVCAMGTDCRQYFLVEHNGDVYPCDFHASPEWKLGNLMENSWDSFLNSDLYRRFGVRKRQWNSKCGSCQYLRVCAGCCPKNRLGGGRVPQAPSVLCPGWKLFFQHALPKLKSLAAMVKREREEMSRSAPPSPMGAPRPPGGV